MRPALSSRLLIALVLLTGWGIVAGCGEEADRSSEPLLNTPAASDTFNPDVESVGGIMARRMETDGIVADLLDAERTPKALQVTMRFRNVSGETRSFAVDTDDGAYDDWHLTAGGEEIPLLEDEFGDPKAPGELHNTLETGETHLWRGEFAPPPRGVETFDLVFPGLARPFTDVPIEDVEDVEESLLPID